MRFFAWLLKRFAIRFVNGVREHIFEILIVLGAIIYLILTAVLSSPFDVIVFFAPFVFFLILIIRWTIVDWFLKKYEEYKKEMQYESKN